jgi:hypothetical protein
VLGPLGSFVDPKTGNKPAAMQPKGRTLHEIVGSEKTLTARESTVQIPGMGESAVSDTEADEMEEHLRGLGYIE